VDEFPSDCWINRERDSIFTTAYGRVFRTKHEIEKQAEGSAELNQSKMRHKLTETRVAQTGAILLIIGFVIQVFAHMKD
jgi:hypothetical protein